MKKINADNFITDNKTNKVFLSSLIDKTSGALDVDTRSKLKSKIKDFCPDCELLYNTMDVWARDYMPIQLTEDVFLSFTYKPDYLEPYPNCVTNWQLHGVHAKENFCLNIVQMPIILDGGNVVKAVVNGNPCFIMCEKILKENNVSEKAFRDWWMRWWKEQFDGTTMELVLLPWEGKQDNPIGHADGMVRYVGDNCVLMTNYLDFDRKYKDDFGSKMKIVLEKAGFRVETIEFWDKLKDDPHFKDLMNESWCYINYLQVGSNVLVPKLSYSPLDEEAKHQIETALGQTVTVELIDVDMTPIVKDLNSQQNSGGALNCLSWTIKA